MTKEEYFEKLKDPRWQAKRLEIFQRDKFTCQNCGAIDKTLTVHHYYYDINLEPWEYPNEALITLCEDCHKNIQKSLKLLKESIKNIIFYDDLEYIRGFIDSTNNHGDEDGKFLLTSYEYASGICVDTKNLVPEDLINNRNKLNYITMKKINNLQKAKRKR